MATATDDRSVLAAAADALADLAALDLDTLTADELSDAVLEMHRLRGTLEATEARLLARWDADRVWQASGARTGAAWLSSKQRIPIQTARQRIRHARAMRTLPEVESAWVAGEIDRTHVTTLLGVRTARTKAAFETDHKELLDTARTKGFADFKRRCDMWAATVDPDGAEQGADDDRAAREVHFSQTFGGVWFGRMTHDPVSGQIIHDTLTLIERELFEADWADAKARLGREPLTMELTRTPAQRRADALVEMATRARTAPAGGRRPAPLFTVLVDYETFAGPILELFNRTVLTPGTAVRWLTEADIERIVFDSPSRVIDVGKKRRFYRGALRRAIEVRDRTCFHPMCDEVPDRPEIDHIREASKGGETTQTNGQYGCGFHNRWRYTHPDCHRGEQASPHHSDPDAAPTHPTTEQAGPSHDAMSSPDETRRHGMDAKNLADLYDLPTMEWAPIEARLDEGVSMAPGTGGPDRHSCWLATINEDGSPHVTGLGALWVDGAPSAGPPPWRVYELTPKQATALATVEPGGATRWTF